MDTTALDAIMARIPTLGDEDIRVLHASWEGGDVEVRRRAWRHGKRLLESGDAADRYQAASELVRSWVNDSRSVASRSNALAFGTIPSFLGQDRLDQRIAAAPALLDAVLAAIVGDELDPDERDELTAPWLEVLGGPAPIADAWAAPDG